MARDELSGTVPPAECGVEPVDDIDTLSVGALGFGSRFPREPGFIPPGSGAFVHYTPGFFSVRAMARRATLFIDGNNWYHGLKGLGSVDLGRLDYRRLSLKLLGPRQWVGTRYYIGRVPQSGDGTLYTSQRRFLAKLESEPRGSTHLGRLEPRPATNPTARDLRSYLSNLSTKIDFGVFQDLMRLARRQQKTTVFVEKAVDGSRWQLLVKAIDPGDDFDRVASGAGRLEVSAHGRMERLLRQTGVPAGLLSNGRTLRLVSAPRGESSGWLDLHVADIQTTAGRPIVAALRLLLSEMRLLALPRDKRFAALLADSRRFQNEVSERLAEQVLHALYELLRGVQAADDASDRELLREALDERPDDLYHALLTVILRLVFLLYAEERDLLPEGETFARHYSLAGLYERLREDAALNPDTMSWASRYLA